MIINYFHAPPYLVSQTIKTDINKYANFIFLFNKEIICTVILGTKYFNYLKLC